MLQVREEMAQLSLGAAPTLPDQEAVPTLLSLLPSDTVISPKEAFSSVPTSNPLFTRNVTDTTLVEALMGLPTPYITNFVPLGTTSQPLSCPL